MPEAAAWRLSLAGEHARLFGVGEALTGAVPQRSAPGSVQSSAQTLATLDALLLAWLVLEGPTARDRLATLLWPESDEASARNALRQRLFRLRRNFGDVVQGSALLTLHPACRHDLDGAAGLLGQVKCPVPGELAHWLAQRRAVLGGAQAQALAQRAQEFEDAGRWTEGLALAQEALKADPLSEVAHRRVMRLNYLAGDPAAALLAFDACEQMLKHEVGTHPSVQTLELLHTIEQGQVLPATGAPKPGSRPAPLALPAAVLRPPRLVGREADLAQMQQALQQAHVVVLLGEAGMGKTRLLQSVAAPWPGMRMVQARPGDHLAPYSSLARALREAASGVDLPAEHHPGLAAVLPERTLPGASPPNPAAVLGAVHALLASVSCTFKDDAPPVLALDDLHFADTASLELLQSLLAAPRAQPAAGQDLEARPASNEPDKPLRWCLGLRPPAENSAQAELLRAIAAATPCTQLLLQPLGPAQLESFVTSLKLPGVDAGKLTPQLHARTGGNPLYVLETLKLAWNEGLIGQHVGELAAAPPALPRPATLAQLVGQQLSRLSPAALMLARVAAIAGIDFSLDLAAVVLEQHPLALADSWAELEAQQVLREAQFVHDLIHDAVLQAVPAIIARHLHARVAHHLHTRGAEPARIAAHWEAAGQPDKALPALQAAARKAQAALRGAESIALQLHAAELAQAQGDDGTAFEAVRSALQTHMHTLRASAGWPLLERLQALARSPLQQAQAAAERAWYGTVLGQWDSSASDGQAALALALPTHDDNLICSVRQRLGTALALQGRFDEALPQMQAAQPWIDAHAPARDRSEFHGNLATMLDNLGQPLQAQKAHLHALSLTRGEGEQAHRVSQLANHALSRLEAGHVHEALKQAQAAQQIVSAYELDSASAGFIAVLMAQALRVLGRLGEALQYCERAHDILLRRNASRLPVLLLQRAHVHLDTGQLDRAAKDLSAAGKGPLAPRYEVRRCVLQARLASWQGADAQRPLTQAREALPSSGWPELAWMVQAEAAALGLLPPPQAAKALTAIAKDAAERGLLGSVWVAQARLVQCGALSAPAASAAAAAALALAQGDPPVASPWLSTPEWAWALHEGLQRFGRGPADATMRDLRHLAGEWLHSAEESLPQPLRASFWQLHPAHRSWQA